MEKQISFLSQVPFPSDPHLQCWITSTFYVLTSESESEPLWPVEEATINSSEPALVSSFSLPSWAWLTHCYTLLIPHSSYDSAYTSFTRPRMGQVAYAIMAFCASSDISYALAFSSTAVFPSSYCVVLWEQFSSRVTKAAQLQHFFKLSWSPKRWRKNQEFPVTVSLWSRCVRTQMGNTVVQWLPLGAEDLSMWSPHACVGLPQSLNMYSLRTVFKIS